MFGPISPHLLIYKPQFSSIFSVLHRASGGILAVAMVCAAFFFDMANSYICFYKVYSWMFFFNTYGGWFVISLLIITICAFFYHISNGIRHLIWDFGNGSSLNKVMVKRTGLMVLTSFFILFLLFFMGLGLF